MCELHRKQRLNACSVERRTVFHHLHFIRKEVSTYAGMPFCAFWDPKKGGSYKAGEDWIVNNIGRRPAKGYDLHIVDRQIGFMPGNLQWVPRDHHRRKELINQLLVRVQVLEKRLQVYEK